MQYFSVISVRGEKCNIFLLSQFGVKYIDQVGQITWSWSWGSLVSSWMEELWLTRTNYQTVDVVSQASLTLLRDETENSLKAVLVVVTGFHGI